MNVSLTPELEALVRRKVESGRYASSSEVIREALRIMERYETLQLLREEVRKGIGELDRGEGIELTDQTMDRLRQEAEAESRSGEPISDVVKP